LLKYGCLIVAWLLYVDVQAEPVTERQRQLLDLLHQDCGSCHGLTLKGGLGPALLPESLKNKKETDLVQTILQGRAGTAMPPWQDFLTHDEALWLVNFLLKK
jgi:cytochrome c55X